MKPAYAGIDVAFAKQKRLPLVVCTREEGRLVPLPLRSARGLVPPRGSGNRASLSAGSVEAFTAATLTYLRQVEEAFAVSIDRIAIDAPSAPALDGRRRAERALDARGFSCFATPTAEQFDEIRRKALEHLEAGGPESRLPHANQLWMLVGFELFRVLSELAPCLEVFPNTTVQVLGAAHRTKFHKDGLEAQLAAARAHTGWPGGAEDEPALHDIGYGSTHDKLDAYLCAWVASLKEEEREPFGAPPDDVIWVPRVEGGAFPSAEPIRVERRTRSRTRPAASVPEGKSSRACPGCSDKVFKRWPWGWDAHAAYRCEGLEATDPEERKREFRDRFREAFA